MVTMAPSLCCVVLCCVVLCCVVLCCVVLCCVVLCCAVLCCVVLCCVVLCCVVLCCVVLCCVCLHNYSIIFNFLANQLINIDRDKGQTSKLCTTVYKKPPQKHPYIIRCSSVE
jgi:hypothetical protein